MADAKFIISPIGRLSFASLFAPKVEKNDKGEEKKQWQCNLIFPEGTDLSELKAAANEAAKAKWQDKIPKNLRSPFRNTEDYADRHDGYQDPGTFIAFKRDAGPPGVINGDRSKITPESGLVYSGCFGRVSCKAYAWHHPKNGPGVSFELIGFQKTGDGDPLGNAVQFSEEMFPVADGFDAGSGVAGSTDISDDIFK